MKGSCLCGAVTFQTAAKPGGFAACHCTQCRKQSGHVWASAHVPDKALTIQGDVRWYPSSEKAKRGFCPVCGSALFWKHVDDPHISFSLGSVDGATDAHLRKHIFTPFKGDYYDIADGVPQS
ncbi:MAG: GFA family protein [Pseudomonadota bacterium]